MKRVGVVAFVALGLWCCLRPMSASAQSVDIPLNYALNTNHNYGGGFDPRPVLILTINIGVNGGPAQAYAFDTGSSVFVAPPGTFSASNLQAFTTNLETYASVNTFTGNIYQIPASALTFYATPGATTGGISLGTSGTYTVGSYIDLNGHAPPMNPFGTAVVGAFGASGLAFNNDHTTNSLNVDIPFGGVLGQAVAPNGTTAGYIVSANGQSLAALNAELGTDIRGGPITNAPQAIQTVPRSLTNCNPCLTFGLTPALLAQFLPMNTVSATGNGNNFPNSNTPDIKKFVSFNFTLTTPGSPPSQFSQTVSLDTGWTDFALFQNVNAPGTVLTMYTSGGTQLSFAIAGTPFFVSPYAMGPNTDGFIGTGFFVANAVLYDLNGQQVGYSPNFVTDANITTTTAQPFVIDGSSVPLGLAGVISGPGGVSINAGGSATLSGTNTYTGPTTVSGTGAYLALVGPGSIAASSGVNVSSGGVFDISNANSPAVIKSLSGDANGTVWLGNNYLALSNASGLFGGTLAGSGGLMLLSGNETLAGSNAYTGMTVVGGGTLNVTGSIASSALTIVAPGAALTGTGTVGPLTVTGGGTFAPAWGVPGGAMTVAGDLTLSPGAIYAVQLGSSTTPFANVSGNASLAGTVVASPAPGSAIFKQYDILHSAALNGTSFDAVSFTSLPGFSAQLSTSTTDVYLGLTARLAALTSSLGANAQHIAQALDAAFNSGGSLPSGLASLYTLSGPALGNALTQSSGETATGSQQTTFNAMSQFINLLTDPLGRGNGVNGATATPYAEDDSVSAYAERKRLAAERTAYAMFTKAPLAKVYEPRWSVWASGFGGSQTTDGNTAAGSNSTTSSIFGTAVGADYLLSPRTIAGFALAGGGTNFSVVNGGSGRSDLFQAGAYLRHTSGAAYVSAALAYGWQDITTDRTVTIAGADHLRAEFNANAWSGRLEGGYRFVAPWKGGVGITPYAAVQFTTFELPAYAESVISGMPAFAQSYAARSVTDTRSELGIRADKSFALQSGVLTLRSRLAWVHDFDPDRAVAATFLALPGASFVVNGAAQAHDAELTTLAADINWLNGWSARAAFEGEFSDVTRSYAGKGVVRYSW